MATTSAIEEGPFEKSQKLGRPLSPHVTIYRFPFPSIVSISHRVTGGVMSAALWSATIGYVASGMTFQEIHSALLASNPTLLLGFKFAIVWPFCYHGINGIRHMVWDTGTGLGSMRSVYTTGWIVLITSTLTALGLAYYTHS
jgi:succinate dehydrogenase (ubiquinone) cytochrome b560 subunit